MVLLLATCLFWVCTDVIVVDRISWCTSSVLKEIYIHVLPDVNEFVRVYQNASAVLFASLYVPSPPRFEFL